MGLTTERMSMTQTKQSGFTLVELAIALMVIGLLIGGVLKGQELIENARITRFIKDINDYDTAVMIFRNTYNALPGDLRQPTRLPNCNTAPCNNLTSVGTGTVATHIKSANFWRHLERTGLITGINDAETYPRISPQNPWGTHTGMYHTIIGNATLTNDPRQHRFLTVAGASQGMPASRMLQIDTKIDDGKPLSGSVQQQGITATWESDELCYNTSTLEYLQDSSIRRCSLGILSSTMN